MAHKRPKIILGWSQDLQRCPQDGRKGSPNSPRIATRSLPLFLLPLPCSCEQMGVDPFAMCLCTLTSSGKKTKRKFRLGCLWCLWVDPGLLLGSGLLWAALVCTAPELLWAALGCFGLPWAALGCSGLLLAALGCSARLLCQAALLGFSARLLWAALLGCSRLPSPWTPGTSPR